MLKKHLYICKQTLKNSFLLEKIIEHLKKSHFKKYATMISILERKLNKLDFKRY